MGTMTMLLCKPPDIATLNQHFFCLLMAVSACGGKHVRTYKHLLQLRSDFLLTSGHRSQSLVRAARYVGGAQHHAPLGGTQNAVWDIGIPPILDGSSSLSTF